MSFYVGQVVTVHPSIMDVGRYGGVTLNNNMLRMKGSKMIISAMDARINRYLVAENRFTWTQEMLIDWEEFSMPSPWVCNDCGEHMDASEGTYWVNGLRVCQDCFEDRYAICNICGMVYSRDDETYIDGHGSICPTCLS